MNLRISETFTQHFFHVGMMKLIFMTIHDTSMARQWHVSLPLPTITDVTISLFDVSVKFHVSTVSCLSFCLVIASVKSRFWDCSVKFIENFAKSWFCEFRR